MTTFKVTYARKMTTSELAEKLERLANMLKTSGQVQDCINNPKFKGEILGGVAGAFWSATGVKKA